MMIGGAVLYHVPLMDTTEKRIALCLYVLVCACQAQAFKVYVSVDMEGIRGKGGRSLRGKGGRSLTLDIRKLRSVFAVW